MRRTDLGQPAGRTLGLHTRCPGSSQKPLLPKAAPLSTSGAARGQGRLVTSQLGLGTREGRPGQEHATWTRASCPMARPAGLKSLLGPEQAWVTREPPPPITINAREDRRAPSPLSTHDSDESPTPDMARSAWSNREGERQRLPGCLGGSEPVLSRGEKGI